MSIKVKIQENKELILEEITKSELKDLVKKELQALLKSSETKNDIGEVAKEILKKLYKELSMQQTHVIDNIKI